MKLTNLCGCFLVVSSLPVAANTPTWVKNSSSYIKDGEITLKRENGSDFNINLNQKNVSRTSQARTPNIMVVGSDGGYAWAHGFKMNNDIYYIYETELGIYVPFSADVFHEKFDFEEDKISYITTNYLNIAQTGSISIFGTAMCGNSEWAANNNCRVTDCSINVGSIVNNGTSCSASGSMSNGNFGAEISLGSITERGFEWGAYAWADVWGTFKIPSSFKALLGDSVSGSASGSRYVGLTCMDTEGNGNNCSRASSTGAYLSIEYFFTDDWQGSGIKVGGYDWAAYSHGSESGYYVVGNIKAELPFKKLSNIGLTHSASQMFIQHDAHLYAFKPGEIPKIVEGLSGLPLIAVNIKGAKN